MSNSDSTVLEAPSPLDQEVALTTEDLPITVAKPPRTLRQAVDLLDLPPITKRWARAYRKRVVNESSSKFSKRLVLSLNWARPGLTCCGHTMKWAFVIMCVGAVAELAASLFALAVVAVVCKTITIIALESAIAMFGLCSYFAVLSLFGKSAWTRLPYDLYRSAEMLPDIPDRVQKTATELRRLLPGVQLFVLYTINDPFLEARYRGRKIYARLWDNDGIIV